MQRALVSIVAAVLVIASTQGVLAQSLGFGVTAGLNSSNVSTDDPEFGDVDSRSGFIGGGYLEVGILPFLSVRPEVVYSQKGVTVNEGAFFYDLNVDYWEIPVMIKLSAPGSFGPVRPYAMAGPAFSFASDCWIYDGEDEEEWDCDELDVEVEPSDSGIALGVGVDASIGPLTGGLSGRYTIGLKTVDAAADPIDIKNRVWSLTASVGFRLFGR